jgi:hypothetical protein
LSAIPTSSYHCLFSLFYLVPDFSDRLLAFV